MRCAENRGAISSIDLTTQSSQRVGRPGLSRSKNCGRISYSSRSISCLASAASCASPTRSFGRFSPSAQQRELLGHEGFIWSAAFSPDGTQLVTAAADKTVRLWNVGSGQVMRALTGHQAPVTAALFSPDGRRVLSCGGDRVLKIWDA